MTILSLKVLTPSDTPIWSPVSGGITSPIGFKASGIRAGLKASGNPDLALLLAPKGSVCAGTFTQSSLRAACIDICIDRLQINSGRARAVVINSGQANAFTGDQGVIDTLLSTRAIAEQLGLSETEVLMSSTGVIGEAIPMQNLLKAVNSLVDKLSVEGGNDAANAILTTDLIDKQIAFEAVLGDRVVKIGGMAKGSGMIHPNMSTMLSYISCDAGVAPETWSEMIKRIATTSFNAITVDGDTSTNDSFLAFSSGQPLDIKYLDSLELGLQEAAQFLAKSIARDGEGASCLIEVIVKGANQSSEAHQIAKIIAGSPLVKTAIHGCDPNWGRIVAAIGRSGVSCQTDDISLWIGCYQLIERGQPLSFERSRVSKYIRQRMEGEYLHDDCVSITLDLGKGSGSGFAWGCDMSAEYVRINAEYTT
tara:strand:- start:484 stop:1749 length:1266 start_codon:yes stop_codon:yes gene_type:complete